MNLQCIDLRYAWRLARNSPGVTLAIIAMIALSTGGVSVVFNPIYSQIFAPLSFHHPEQLVIIGGDIPLFNTNFNRFERREELNTIFSNLTAFAPNLGTRITLPDSGKEKEVYVVEVSEEFFETLGVMPLRGSDFQKSKERQAVIISNRFWRNELMQTDEAIGKSIQDPMGRMFYIIGIMPETFDFPTGADIWMYRGETTFISQTRRYLGRLQPEVSLGGATEKLSSIEFKPGVGLYGNKGPVLQSLGVVIYGDRAPLLWMLGSVAVLFLLLVCAGVVNLLVTQGVRRKSEMTMRMIMGATRKDLIIQLLLETLLLIVVGTFLGLWLSEIASAWLMAQFPELKGGEVVLPVKMLFFTAMVLTVTIIGGLTPALYATGADLNTYLKSGSNLKRRLYSLSLRELMVGIQLCLSLVLLTGVGLLVNSMMFHVDVPISWSSRDMVVVTAEFTRVPNTNSKPMSVEEIKMLLKMTLANNIELATRRATFSNEFQNFLRSMPEVANVGIFKPIPFSSEAIRKSQSSREKVYKTRPPDQPWDDGWAGIFSVDVLSGYTNPEGFNLLGIPLIAGRSFSQIDIDNALTLHLKSLNPEKTGNEVSTVVIINQSLARQMWPGENIGNTVGKIIYNGKNAVEIIGVVQDFYLVSYNKEFVPGIYKPESNANNLEQTFLVKLHSGALMKDFWQRLYSFDAGSITINASPLREIVSEATTNMRMTIQLLGSFALLGIVLAGLSVYATTSLMVVALNREIGIRMSMGATTWNILRLMLWRGIRTILFALPAGLFLSWTLSQILSSLLFQVIINDPLPWVVSCVVLIGIALIAVLIPALRATHINPLDAIRNE